MNNSTSRKTIMINLKSICDDLESTYLGKKAALKWNGIGHDAAAFISRSQDLGNDVDIVTEYVAYKATTKNPLPFSEWVKDIECHNCHEKGHTAKMCDKPLRRNLQRTRRLGRRGQRMPAGNNTRTSRRGRERDSNRDRRRQQRRGGPNTRSQSRQDEQQNRRQVLDQAFAAISDIVLDASDDDEPVDAEEPTDNEEQAENEDESDARISYTCAQVMAGFDALKE
jgi:hypothetical protein